MADRDRLEAMLVAHLDVVARIAGSLCRRGGVVGADADDFAAWVRLRLVEHDYAILARFRGESSLPTFLTVVVTMLFRDWRVQRDGRWRPSAAALHAGPAAVRLERLLHRDRVPFDQAAVIVQMHEVPPPTLRELAALARRLLGRAPLRPRAVGEEAIAARAGSLDAEAAVARAEEAAAKSTVERALHAALAGLPAEDRAILRMRFWEGASVADVARALRLEQKPLYRRLERLLTTLRRALEAHGVDGSAVVALLGVDGATADASDDVTGGTAGTTIPGEVGESGRLGPSNREDSHAREVVP